jgi:hypothetical protein
VSILAVVGAGPLGAAITHQAAAAAIARRIVLVDDAADVARGLALDIRQSGPISGSSTAVEGTGDTGAVVGASVIVMADRHGAGEWRGDDGLALVARLRTLAPRALILCAGAAQSDMVESFVRERDGDRRRIAGSAPEALRSALTALACLETGAAPADVSLAAIGRPPKEMFVPWSRDRRLRAADVLPVAVIARIGRCRICGRRGRWRLPARPCGRAARDRTRPGWVNVARAARQDDRRCAAWRCPWWTTARSHRCGRCSRRAIACGSSRRSPADRPPG